MSQKAGSTSNSNVLRKRKAEVPAKLQELPLDMQVQARTIFFAYYIADFSQIWDFLYPCLDPRNTPEHVSLGIDAVSLAFLSHHTTCPSAQTLGRKKYVSALSKTKEFLQYPGMAQQASMLEASLLLDLFEKLTTSRPSTVSTQRAHVDGALALVKLRGLEQFTDASSVKALLRLALNIIVTCIHNVVRVPEDMYAIRAHLAQFTDVSHPKWRLTDVILDITDLMCDANEGLATGEEKLERCIDLERRLEIIEDEGASVWTYKRIYVLSDEATNNTLDGFYDIYGSRIDTQTRNVQRFMRLVLFDEIIATSTNPNDEVGQRAYRTSATLIADICASVPQMTDCAGPARSKLPVGSTWSSHTHTLSHFLDTYILLFGLYAAGWSRACPLRTRKWIIGQLERIAEHFGVKEAAAIAAILKTQEQKARVRPWDVYTLLGSYAFAA